MLTPKIDTSELATAVATALIMATEMSPGEIWQLDASVACYVRQGDPAPLVIPDAVFTATNGTETLNIASHGLETGDGPVRVSSDTTLPSGLLAATDYWVIKTGAGTLKLATSRANALAGTNLLLASDGSGIHTLSDTADTERVSGFVAAAATGSMYVPAGATRMIEPGYEQGSFLSVIRASGDGAVTLTEMRYRPDGV